MGQLFVNEAGEYRVAADQVIIDCARAAMARRFRVGSPVLDSPQRTREFLQLRLSHLNHEIFGMLHLNARYRLMAVEDLFRGTIDGAAVYPREIVRSVIEKGSAAVLLYHNHPTNQTSPSRADDLITARVKSALEIIEVKVVDHLIIGHDVYSYAEAGRL